MSETNIEILDEVIKIVKSSHTEGEQTHDYKKIKEINRIKSILRGIRKV